MVFRPQHCVRGCAWNWPGLWPVAGSWWWARIAWLQAPKKPLVLSGFSHIDSIDLDTIDVSNLNRQFLFQKKHVGRSKAQVTLYFSYRFLFSRLYFCPLVALLFMDSGMREIMGKPSPCTWGIVTSKICPVKDWRLSSFFGLQGK